MVHLATGDATGGNLAGEIEALRATATLMREQIADLREDRDHWRDQAQRLALARPATPELPPVTPTAETGSVAAAPDLALAALDGVSHGRIKKGPQRAAPIFQWQSGFTETLRAYRPPRYRDWYYRAFRSCPIACCSSWSACAR